MHIGENYGYLAGSFPSFYILDISNFARPFETSSLFLDYTYDLTVSENYAYIADSSGLKVIDVSDPFNASQISKLSLNYDAYSVFVSGKYAYVANGTEGLRIVSINDPSAPVEIGFYDTPGSSRDVFVSGEYAYVADHQSGLRIIDVKNPSNPIEVGSFECIGFCGYVHSVFVSEELAYLGAYYQRNVGTVRIINVKKATNPFEVGFSIRGSANDICTNGDLIYVADGYHGVSIYTYSPSPAFYVNYRGYCGDDYRPCFSSLQEAIDLADSSAILKVANGNYDGVFILSESKSVTLECGFDSWFESQISYSTIEQLVVERGTLIVENLVIAPN